MAAVKALCVDAIDLAHQARQIRLARLQNQVIVIAHQAIRPGPRVKAVQRLRYNVKKLRPVKVVLRNRLTPVTAGRDVIHRARVFDAKGSDHGRSLVQPCGECKMGDLTLYPARQCLFKQVPKRKVALFIDLTNLVYKWLG